MAAKKTKRHAKRQPARRVRESYDSPYGELVDPRDAYRDEDGGRDWLPLGLGMAAPEREKSGIGSERELADVRELCRYLARRSAYAINAHQNRISYTVGEGHKYTAVKKKGSEPEGGLLTNVQAWLDDWLYVNKWRQRQQEIVRRMDRDGEAFLRFFPQADGLLLVRFVEPEQVSTPQEKAQDPSAAFGIQTEPDDVEDVKGYYIDGKLVSAESIQHRKANVDLNTRRGSPLFWPVVDTIRNVRMVRQNMTIGSKLQTSVAYTKTVKGGTAAEASTLRSNASDFSSANARTGRTDHYQQHRPGKIITKSDAVEYDFPWAKVNYATYCEVIADSLREVASLVVMPEFMLTSDASNANYSSTMVAEGPAVKMFERLQADLERDDLAVIWMAIEWAVERRALPAEVLELVEIQVARPGVTTRDENKEAVTNSILIDKRVMSRQTAAARHGLDFQEEQRNIEADGALPGAVTLPDGGTTGAVLPTLPDTGRPQQTAQDTVLNGAQVTAATAIVMSVADGKLPRDAGLGQLKVMFNLTDQQAALMMGSAGTDRFEQRTVVPPEPVAVPADDPIVKAAEAILREEYP